MQRTRCPSPSSRMTVSWPRHQTAYWPSGGHRRAGSYAKKALSFAKLTNDGDEEGAFFLDRLPSKAEAEDGRHGPSEGLRSRLMSSPASPITSRRGRRSRRPRAFSTPTQHSSFRTAALCKAFSTRLPTKGFLHDRPCKRGRAGRVHVDHREAAGKLVARLD